MKALDLQVHKKHKPKYTKKQMENTDQNCDMGRQGQQKKLKVFADNESKAIREMVSKLTTTKSTE